MAYLKGNSLFPAQNFNVDIISRAWNMDGVVDSSIINNSDFSADSYVTVNYYKLKNIAVIYIDGVLKPSTVPYTGVPDDTSYIYTGEFEFERVNTTANVRMQLPALSSAPYHFENTMNVEDYRTGVFFEPNRNSIMASVHINGILDSTKLVVTIPSGMLPNHEYQICGTLIYQCL